MASSFLILKFIRRERRLERDNSRERLCLQYVFAYVLFKDSWRFLPMLLFQITITEAVVDLLFSTLFKVRFYKARILYGHTCYSTLPILISLHCLYRYLDWVVERSQMKTWPSLKWRKLNLAQNRTTPKPSKIPKVNNKLCLLLSSKTTYELFLIWCSYQQDNIDSVLSKNANLILFTTMDSMWWGRHKDYHNLCKAIVWL